MIRAGIDAVRECLKFDASKFRVERVDVQENLLALGGWQ